MSKNMRSALFIPVRKSLLLALAATVFGSGMISYASAPANDPQQAVRNDARSSSGFFSFMLPVQGSIRNAMEIELRDGQVGDIKLSDAVALQTFYTARDNDPLWIKSRSTQQGKAEAVLNVLENSWTHALNPQSYHVAEIRPLLKAATPADKARLDILLSDGVIRYTRDMTGMHLPPAAIRQDAQFWRKPMAADAVLQAAADDHGGTGFLKKLEPTDKLYTQLRSELMTLASDARRSGDQYLPISFGGLTLLPGNVSRDVPKLRGRLGLSYDAKQGPETKYDDKLMQAVMAFQAHHELTPDGHIGQKTLAMLNRPAAQKINQLIANMERLRWLELDRPDRYIVVNIPQQKLWAIDHDKVAVTMPVIVGKPERPTKNFVTQISGVRFNPKWTVPPTVKTNDFLPRLIEDPTFLAAKGIDVSYTAADGHREYIDSTQVDWAQLSEADLRRLHMVQSAGDDNALGKIRVLMENPYDIYLHDTVNHALFSKPERLLSSGCIRLSDPEAVARFILTDNKGWSDRRMHAIIDTGRTTEIPAASKIPVYILYQTVWLDDKDNIVYGPDVYGQDKALIRDLTALNSFSIPDAEKIKFAALDTNSPLR